MASTTEIEWQVLGVSLFVLSLVLTYAVSMDLLYAISVGLRAAIGLTAVLVIITFSWRRLQSTSNLQG